MIMDIFLLLLSIPLTVILSVMTGISELFETVLPNAFFTAIDTSFSYLGYFSGVLPLNTLITCISTLVTFYYFYYFFKIALWAWSIIPWIGKKQQLPQIFNRK